jgi:HK97 gp10 family phage protein
MPSKTIVIAAPANQLKQFRAEVEGIVRKTAFLLEGKAKQLAPVDTGFLRNSITTQKLADATYSVAVGAEYGIYVEFGTRWMRAQPYFTPAIEEARRYFDGELKKLVA